MRLKHIEYVLAYPERKGISLIGFWQVQPEYYGCD